jgi:hypothetical protein
MSVGRQNARQGAYAQYQTRYMVRPAEFRQLPSRSRQAAADRSTRIGFILRACQVCLRAHSAGRQCPAPARSARWRNMFSKCAVFTI